MYIKRHLNELNELITRSYGMEDDLVDICKVQIMAIEDTFDELVKRI